MSLEWLKKLLSRKKKIMSRSFLNSGILIVIYSRWGRHEPWPGPPGRDRTEESVSVQMSRRTAHICFPSIILKVLFIEIDLTKSGVNWKPSLKGMARRFSAHSKIPRCLVQLLAIGSRLSIAWFKRADAWLSFKQSLLAFHRLSCLFVPFWSVIMGWLLNNWAHQLMLDRLKSVRMLYLVKSCCCFIIWRAKVLDWSVCADDYGIYYFTEEAESWLIESLWSRLHMADTLSIYNRAYVPTWLVRKSMRILEGWEKTCRSFIDKSECPDLSLFDGGERTHAG
jgi:hypothetical protein